MARRPVRCHSLNGAFVFGAKVTPRVAFTDGSKTAMLKEETHQHLLTSVPDSWPLLHERGGVWEGRSRQIK